MSSVSVRYWSLEHLPSGSSAVSVRFQFTCLIEALGCSKVFQGARGVFRAMTSQVRVGG